jgi:L-amino acid N-acyltransferase YncA
VNGREPFSELELRPVRAEDCEAVVAMFHGLSPHSLYMRFLTLMPDPTPLVVRHLSLVDARDHGAMVVLDGDEVVAISHWDRSGAGGSAEIATTVADEWQHRGLGRALARAVAGDALRHGVDILTARVLAENRAAQGLALDQQPAATEFDGTETNFTFELAS